MDDWARNQNFQRVKDGMAFIGSMSSILALRGLVRDAYAFNRLSDLEAFTITNKIHTASIDIERFIAAEAQM